MGRVRSRAGAFVAGIAILLASGSVHSSPKGSDSEATFAEIYPVADLPVWRLTEDGKTQFDPSILIAHLKTSMREAWNADGTIVASAEHSALIIRQTRQNHRKVADVLEKLRPAHDGETREILDRARK